MFLFKGCQNIFLIIICGIVIISCKKLIEVDPPINEIVGEDVYKSDASAANVLTGIYYLLSNSSVAGGSGSVSIVTSLSADELTISHPVNNDFLTRFYTNNLSASVNVPYSWNDLYSIIFRANSAIEGISQSNTLSIKVKRQLIGEAKFIRAFCYFNLINLYGDVPLIITTDYNISQHAERISTAIVYEQIVSDLITAQADLNEDYLAADAISTSLERIRPNKVCATFLLSRVYLYMEEWEKAETESTKVINDNRYVLLQDLNEVFLKNSKETVWQLQPVVPGLNTADGNFLIPNGSPDNIVSVNSSLYSFFSPMDIRMNKWIDSIDIAGEYFKYPAKYKVKFGSDLTEYTMVFRLAEQFLIRAEARAHLGKISGLNTAEPDINAIRTRSGLTNTMATTQSEMLDAIQDERRVELFAEWGHRWFDLKRTGRVNQIMNVETPLKGGNWQDFKKLFPIPQEEIDKNPSLVGKQNPGY